MWSHNTYRMVFNLPRNLHVIAYKYYFRILSYLLSSKNSYGKYIKFVCVSVTHDSVLGTTVKETGEKGVNTNFLIHWSGVHCRLNLRRSLLTRRKRLPLTKGPLYRPCRPEALAVEGSFTPGDPKTRYGDCNPKTCYGDCK